MRLISNFISNMLADIPGPGPHPSYNGGQWWVYVIAGAGVAAAVITAVVLFVKLRKK